MDRGTEREQLLYKVAKAYYDDDETQQAISERFGVSRVKVCRLLKQARDEGFVSISIHGPGGDTAELERELAARYGIRESIIVENSGGDVATYVGTAAAAYFTRIVQEGQTVALSWGKSLLAFVNALEPLPVADVRVVQMLGGLGDSDADVHGAELARRMAQRLGTKPRLLQAPGVVSSREVRDALLSDAQISETLDAARKADVALIGIGTLDDASLLRGTPIISAAELSALSRSGAVGDAALRFFDAQGKSVPSGTDDRGIGLNLDEIRRISRRVAIAWGFHKIAAIRGALLGGLVSTLITDTEAAKGLLE
jgi:DNA-binding transcriptional regulator LsrR (DeoR family)